MFVLCLIALFGFLRHGAWISDRLLDTADRILGDPGKRLARRMVGAVRDTANGTVLVAFAEGFLSVLPYVLAGVPSPVLFTLLTRSPSPWCRSEPGRLSLGPRSPKVTEVRA